MPGSGPGVYEILTPCVRQCVLDGEKRMKYRKTISVQKQTERIAVEMTQSRPAYCCFLFLSYGMRMPERFLSLIRSHERIKLISVSVTESASSISI